MAECRDVRKKHGQCKLEEIKHRDSGFKIASSEILLTAPGDDKTGVAFEMISIIMQVFSLF